MLVFRINEMNHRKGNKQQHRTSHGILPAAGLAGGSYVRDVLGHTGNEGSVSTWGCLGMALAWQC